MKYFFVNISSVPDNDHVLGNLNHYKLMADNQDVDIEIVKKRLEELRKKTVYEKLCSGELKRPVS